MQLLALVGTGTWVHMLLVSSAFDAWHALFTAHPFYGPLAIACVVSLALDGGLPDGGMAGPSPAGLRRRLREPPGGLGDAGAGGGRLGRRDRAARDRDATGARRASPRRGCGRASPRPSTTSRCSSSVELGRTVPAGAKLTCSPAAAVAPPPAGARRLDLHAHRVHPAARRGAVPADAGHLRRERHGPTAATRRSRRRPFVGQQTMRDAHGHSIVNPLFTIYGCFNTL